MELKVDVDVSGFVKELEFAQRQIPFMVAATLTDTARQAQKDTQASLTSRSGFILRNKWTESSIRYMPAPKKGVNGRIQADVHTDFSRRPGATDYLALQEENYVKVSDHTFLCVPTDALRRMAGGKGKIIPDELRPANLLRYADGRFQYAVTRGKMKGTLRSVRSAAVRGMVFFTSSHGLPIHLSTGARGIWGRAVGDPRRVYLLYVMVHQTKNIGRRFYMEEVVQESVDANFRSNWDSNWDQMFARGVRL